MSIVELTPWTPGLDNQAMLRIQLVVEDYAELMNLSTSLKKVGFDVASLQNSHALAEGLLTLNPDVLIMTARGRKVNGIELAQQIKKRGSLPHVVLLHDGAPENVPGIEAWIKSPADGAATLSVIARICALSERVLLAKFGASLVSPDQSRIGASSLGGDARKARYEKFLVEPKPQVHGTESERVRTQVRALRQSEVGDEDLERERREFVEQLFKKKGS